MNMTMTNRVTRIVVCGLLLLLGVTPADAAAQPQTGTIAGRVTDAKGSALPGVLLTMVCSRGESTQTSGAHGDFRFLGLDAGTYEVRASINGFKPRTRSNLVVTIGKTIDLRLVLEPGGVSDAIIEAGAATEVDTTTTETNTSLSPSLLFSMPIARVNPAGNLLNYAPGINSGSAFGGTSGVANAILVDGVDVRDPESGAPAVSVNFNVIDQVQIGSLGRFAESGGFSGAIITMVTKSGGNRYNGLLEHRYSSAGLRGDNVTGRQINGQSVASLNPSLRVAGIDTLNDFSAQMGGPIRLNKAFFFVSGQRYSLKEDPDGPRTRRTEVNSRFNGKLTFQPTSSDNIALSFQYDQSNQAGLTGLGGAIGTTDFRAIQQKAPEVVYNGRYRRLLGNSAMVEAKYSGYRVSVELDPMNPIPARVDGFTGAYSGGAGYSAKYDRTRNQLNVALSKYAEAKGTHAFKFGVELERSTVRNQFAYTDGVYFLEYGGVPFYAYGYSSEIKARNERLSVFAQDQWQVGRLNVNAGVRMDKIKGIGSVDKKTYYDVMSIAKRVGFAFDLFGDGKSVVRGYYGQLYDGAATASWSSALPGTGDFITYLVTGKYPNPTLTEIDRVSGASQFIVRDDIKHPRTDEISLAYERELGHGLKVTGAYVRRDAKNFIDATVIGATWSPANYVNPLTGKVETIYRWANRPNSFRDVRFQIGNVDDVTYNGAPPANVYRTYNGAMVVLSRALQNRWQAQISYVYSKTKGTITNDGFSQISGAQFLTPNLVHVNAEGPVDLDRPQEFKAFAGYQIPVVEISASLFYRVLSSTPWTPFARVNSSTFNWIGSLDLNLEPRGSRRTGCSYPTGLSSKTDCHLQQVFDLRLEKAFHVRNNRLGLYVDAENLFNSGFVTSVQARNPSAIVNYVNASGKAASTVVLLGSPLAFNAPRQITFGGRWSF
jgi:hypothetical protein